MNNDNILPEGFDGVFRFTNRSDEDFFARWNSIEYKFLAGTMSPMIISGESPENVQQIRKKFAHELAEREFYKSQKFQYMNSPERGDKPALYTEADLAPFIQQCLEPLPVVQASARIVKEVNERVFKKDEDGNPVTKVLKSKQGGDGKDDSLIGAGTVIA